MECNGSGHLPPVGPVEHMETNYHYLSVEMCANSHDGPTLLLGLSFVKVFH